MIRSARAPLALALTLVSTSLIACNAQSTQHAAANAPAGTRAFPLPDPALGMTAATVHVPAGWGFAGTVVHANNCVIGGHSFQLNMESADGLTGVLIFPILNGTGFTNPQMVADARRQGCSVVQSPHAADFIKQVVLPHLRPGARVLSVADEPQFAQQVQQLRDQQAQLERMMPPMRTQFVYQAEPVIEAARVRIAYQRNGHDVEEFVSGVTSCHETRYSSSGYSVLECSAPTLIAVHAPAGQLDALVAGTAPPFTLERNPAWEKKMEQVVQAENQAQQQMQQQQQNIANQHNNQIAQGNAQLAYINGAAARSQAAANAINQRGAAIVQAGRNSQAAIDHAAQGTALSMNNTNTFQNGSTGTNYSGLSNNYSHTYDDGHGTILQTNSAYAPGSPAVWTELTPKY